jgi:hypothetical protein
MSIEDDIYEQLELGLMGEHTQIPQWEEVQHRVITEEEEPPRAFRQSKFQEEFEEGWI